jgi:hypothetical protein
MRAEWVRHAEAVMRRLEGASEYRRRAMAELLERRRLAFEPTAGDLVRFGADVDEALATVDERTREAQRVLGVVIYPYLGV